MDPQKIAISIGDPHGIGAEVVLKALLGGPSGEHFQAHIFADERYLRNLARDLGLIWDANVVVHDIGGFPYPPAWGEVSRSAGGYAIRSLSRAAEYCREGKASLLLTAPINKRAVHLAGFEFPGQTEFIGSMCQVPSPAMAFFSDRLNVVLVTVHVPLVSVSGLLSRELIVNKGLLFCSALSRLGVDTPRLAVAGLNPHASEGGLFGSEEQDTVVPAVAELQKRLARGIVTGPVSPDTVFNRALEGEFDGVIALYHDQGLIPIKLVAFDSAVNATLGIPFARTSPDHGTAFDIAGQGIADDSSMKSALRVGLRLAQTPSVVASEPQSGPS